MPEETPKVESEVKNPPKPDPGSVEVARAAAALLAPQVKQILDQLTEESDPAQIARYRLNAAFRDLTRAGQGK